MTTTPFEQRPDPVPAEGTAADPGPEAPADGEVRPDDDGVREDLVPEDTPFRRPEVGGGD